MYLYKWESDAPWRLESSLTTTFAEVRPYYDPLRWATSTGAGHDYRSGDLSRFPVYASPDAATLQVAAIRGELDGHRVEVSEDRLEDYLPPLQTPREAAIRSVWRAPL